MINKRTIGILLTALAGIVYAGAGGLGGIQKKIKFPEYDRTTGRVTSMLTGDRAVPQRNGTVLIQGVRLETYAYDRDGRNVDLIIEAPQCFFNFRTRVVSSDGIMKMRRANGSASLVGRGFVWSQRTSELTITNSVRTMMRDGFTPKNLQ